MQICVIALGCELTVISPQLRRSVHNCIPCVVHDLYRLVTTAQVFVLSAQLGSESARLAGQKGLIRCMC